jgi:hypothetical protein
VDPVLRKLQIPPGTTVTVLKAPPEVRAVVDAWSPQVTVRRRLGRQEHAVVVFARVQAEVEALAAKVAGVLADDGVLWFAYPKRSSPRYRSDITRDRGWQPLGDLGFEAVRQVAIDDDWSALRFRRAEHVGSMARHSSRAMSSAGRRRAATPAEPPDVAAFLDAVGPDRSELVRAVHATVRAAAPGLEPWMWKDMVGYGHYHYRYASGREGDWFVVGLANQKQHVSVYLCAATPEGYLAELNAARLGKVSCGRSCVRIRKLADIDLGVLGELVREAEALTAAGAFAT